MKTPSASWVITSYNASLLERPVILNRHLQILPTTEFHKKSIFVGKCAVLAILFARNWSRRWTIVTLFPGVLSSRSFFDGWILHVWRFSYLWKMLHHKLHSKTPRPAYSSSWHFWYGDKNQSQSQLQRNKFSFACVITLRSPSNSILNSIHQAYSRRIIAPLYILSANSGPEIVGKPG